MKKVFRKQSEIELIYCFFSSLNYGKGLNSFKNFAINLSSMFIVTYDYDKHTLSIKRNMEEDDSSFWNIDGQHSCISNITLVLGENGIGKTTLLRAIAACSSENLNYEIDEYIMLYYSKEHDAFFIKTTCTDVVAVKEKKDRLFECASKNYVFRGKNQSGDIYGFCGFVDFDKNGVLYSLVEEKYINTLTELKMIYSDSTPMDVFYVPVPGDTNSTRFLKRKKLMKTNSIVEDYDIFDFLIDDYRAGSFLKQYPQTYLSGVDITHNENTSVYQERLMEVLKKISMGEYRRTCHSGTRFQIGVDHYTGDSIQCKYLFFSLCFIFYICYICEKDFESGIFGEVLEKFENVQVANNAIVLFNHTVNILNELISSMKGDVEGYNTIKCIIDDLPAEIFTMKNLFLNIKKVVCRIDIDKLDDISRSSILKLLKVAHLFDMKMQKICPWIDIPSIIGVYFDEMSTGEMSLIRGVFAKLYMINRYTNPAQQNKSILLILDEPDNALHLRWIQKFVYNLINILNNRYGNKCIQVIFTSHMPFMATDIPRKHIICLGDKEWRENNYKKNFTYVDGYKEDVEGIRGFVPRNGFMSNYYDILRDAYFIDVPIGEFAQKKYEELIKEINKYKEKESKYTLATLEKYISFIDEPMLRKALEDKLEQMKSPEEQIEEIEKQMKELATRRAWLRKQI